MGRTAHCAGGGECRIEGEIMTNKTLYELRMKAGKSLWETARELHTTVKMISEFEAGKRGLGITRTISLAKIYGCSVQDVVNAQKRSTGGNE